MKTPKHRLFIHSVAISARKQLNSLNFIVRVPKKLRRHLTRYRQVFFTSSILAENQNGLCITANEIREARRFLQANLALTANDSLRNYEGSSGDEDDGRVEIFLEHRIEEYDVRRTSVEFARCFLSGSVAGFSLRSDLSCLGAKRLSECFQKFPVCSQNPESVCDLCVSELHNTARITEERVSSPARLASCICDAELMNSNSTLRELCSAVHRFLVVSLNVREKLTPTNEVIPISLYQDHYSAGDVVNTGEVVQNWLLESNRTGEFFPGRPVVRPRIDFGKTTRA